ncbi:transcription factor IIIA-like [Mizuhopecten yessoensis]|uniref:Transcription factor IIIA n=1 Tax=Mizuhopecten yessoensis TaxID=6573 RepID=A0A210R240_MIZYE|nr:transcription factor IIIA-like [Mizuhopecten yessoensis]OWF54996.1 Transcription factor IIIA [Mizuhopecten yessoensis]
MAAKSDVTTTHEYICSFPDCLKTFSRPDRMDIHQRSHTGEKPFQCVVPGCGKKYARSSHLRRHEQNSHELTGEPHVQKEVSCTVDGCGKKFTLIQNLKKHIKRKHTQGRFTCEYDGCGKSFKKNQHLKVHEFEHTKINPFLCSYEGCGMRFLVPSKLQRHEKVHTGYKCDELGCTEIFSKWTLLRKHIATQHAVERKCPQCDKTFSSRRWLRQHMSVHSSEREVLACPRDNCGRSYLNQRNLLAHIRSYHDGNHKECPHPGCNRRFTAEQKLQQHQKVHNPNLPPPKKRSKKSKQKSAVALLCGVKKEDKHDVDDIMTPQEDMLNLVSDSNDDIMTPQEDRLGDSQKDQACVEMREECFVKVDSCVEKGVSNVGQVEQNYVEKGVSNVGQVEQNGVEMLDDVRLKAAVPCEDTGAMASIKTVSDGYNTPEHDFLSKTSTDTDSRHVTSDPQNMTSDQQSLTCISMSVPLDKMCSCSCFEGQAIDPVPGDLGGQPSTSEHLCVSSTCSLETKSDGSETNNCGMVHTHIGHSPQRERRRGMCEQ